MEAPHPDGRRTIDRSAVRALLTTPDRDVLLMRVTFPDPLRVLWITPGGGLDPGEDLLSGLRRELREEVGHDDFEFGPEVWHQTVLFRVGRRMVRQHNRYFWVTTEPFDPVCELNPDPIEREMFDEYRWWTVEQIARSSEMFAPTDLAARLAALFESGAGEGPIDVSNYAALATGSRESR